MRKAVAPRRYGFLSVAAFRDRVHPGLRGKKNAQPFPRQALVVGNSGAYHLCFLGCRRNCGMNVHGRVRRRLLHKKRLRRLERRLVITVVPKDINAIWSESIDTSIPSIHP
jgi:hypothetical protein